jgi:hypothetical protein
LEDINHRRMNGTLPRQLDFRFIATSSVPLEQLVQWGAMTSRCVGSGGGTKARSQASPRAASPRKPTSPQAQKAL